MAGCVTGKKMYASEAIAVDVLIDAWTKYDYPDGSGPVAVYRCDDCGQFHLTSSGEMNATLARYLREGKIRLLREADRWNRKFKN